MGHPDLVILSQRLGGITEREGRLEARAWDSIDDRDQAGLLDPIDATCLILVPRAATGACRSHDGPTLVPDDHPSWLGQESAGGGRAEAEEEIGVVLGPTRQDAAGDPEGNATPGLTQSDIKAEHRRAVLALCRDEMPTRVEDDHRQRLDANIDRLRQGMLDDRVRLLQCHRCYLRTWVIQSRTPSRRSITPWSRRRLELEELPRVTVKDPVPLPPSYVPALR